jgi:hypothetical protein
MTYRYPGGLVRRTAANTSITGASGVWDLGSQAQAVKTNTWPISGLANPVSGSLRFRASATAYLTRTGSTATNAKLATYSFWFKRGALTTGQWLFTGGTTVSLIGFNGSSDSLSVLGSDTSGEGNITSAVFRDSSAWYHVVIAIDTAQATTADRAKIYVNGVQQAVTVSNGGIGSNSNWGFNTAGSLAIGRYSPVPGSYTDGYMSEVYFVDGQALTPSSFGQTSPITGVWEPIKYTGTYGTNGFYLSLSDTSSIGKDFSGNGNNWTPNNISTASGSTFDLMRDVPTQWAPQGVTDVGGVVRGNYATLNNNIPSAAVINGGLTRNSSSGRSSLSTMILQNGKYYFETTIQDANGNGGVGVKQSTAYPLGDYETAKSATYFANGEYKIEGGSQVAGFSSYTNGDVIGIAVDTTQSPAKIWFAKNNTWQGTGNPTTAGYNLTSGLEYCFMVLHGSGSSSTTASVNFGQQPFTYTPPTGYKSLCTTNLPTPTIGATVATAANKYFDATLYTGNGANNRTISSNLTPDFVWMKDRTNAYSHILIDSVRGTGKYLRTNGTNAENWDGNIFPNSGPTTNGFIVDGGLNVSINADGDSYVGWQWNAGGSTVTNTTGSISAQVRASPTAGFSIATFTGNGTAGATVGHGLGVAPSMIMFKERLTGTSGLVWHTGYGTNQGQMLIDSTAAIYNPGNGLYFNSTYPSSTVVTLGTSGATNGSGSNYVLYSWAAVAGFSAFGSYTGNGSTDGPFVYTGFRPRFILFKCSSNQTSSTVWSIFDTARSPSNAALKELYPNASTAEGTDSDGIDILSNGFKPKRNSEYLNFSGWTYIYMAFAENPFKNSLAR